jgi:glycosyltransferase involved in cell wall biosynthesis
MDVVLFAAGGSDHGHRAISEAQGCARPVVAAAVDGVRDLVDDRRTGLVAAAEPAALAAAVSAILADPVLAERLGTAATGAVDSRRFLPSGSSMAAFFEAVIRERDRERVESPP